MASQIKLCLVGSTGVGKSSLLRRITKHDFEPDDMLPTIEETAPLSINVDGNPRQVIIKDVGGDPGIYHDFCQSWFEDEDGFVLVFSMNSKETFHALPNYLKDIANHGKNKPPKVVLVGTNSDQKKEVSNSDAEVFAKTLSCSFHSVSCKTGEHCIDPFSWLVSEILKGPSILLSPKAEKKDKKEKKEKKEPKATLKTSKTDEKTQQEIERLKQLGIQKQMDIDKKMTLSTKSGVIELCKICNKPIDAMERLEVTNFGTFHTSCFRCSFCGKILRSQDAPPMKQSEILCSFCKLNLDVFFSRVPFSANKQVSAPKLKRSGSMSEVTIREVH